MFKNQFMKASFGLVLSSALVISGCDGDSGEDKTTKSPQTLVEEAKQLIAQKQYDDALALCVTAEELDDTYDEAKYCIMASNTGLLVQYVASLIGIIAGQLSPADYEKNLDAKQLLNAVLSDIEGVMAYMDLYAYKLVEMENPHFQINDFPLGLDPKDLLEIAGSDDIQIEGELSLNMKGTWDKSEAVILGAAINGVQGVIDYLLSHKLVLDNTDIDFDSTEGVANFLATNPELLAGDTDDTARLKGDGATHKGLKLDVLAALSYLVGRDAALEKVSPAHGGLVEAIKNSAAEQASGAIADPVVKWVDADGDGIPEEVGLPALSDLKDKIKDSEGQPIIENDTFENPIAKETWDEIIGFGVALRDNIEADGGDAISLKPILNAIIAEAGDDTTIRLAKREVPDLIGLNPGAFFAAPKYVGELIPYYFSFTTNGTDSSRDIAIEIETYDIANDEYFNEKVGVEAYAGSATDFAHFRYVANDNLGPKTIQSYTFDAFDVTPANLEIMVDNVRADEKSPLLYYIALQDPTLGGLIQGDVEAAGNFGPITSHSFNEGLAKLVKYYCLDLSKDLFDAFDDVNYDAGNKIADCANTF